MARKSDDQVTQEERDRQDELDRQAAVEKAVHDATHDDAGDPLPLPRPDGITIVEGKP